MNISNGLNSCLAVLVLVTASVITGCASTSPASSPYRTERHSAGGVKIESVRLSRTSKGLQVSGSVGRMIGYSNTPRRHLDVEAVSADGVVLTRAAARFIPNPIRHDPRWRTRSAYAVTVPEVPPTGSVVRVVVHATSLSDCRN